MVMACVFMGVGRVVMVVCAIADVLEQCPWLVEGLLQMTAREEHQEDQHNTTHASIM